MSPQAEAALAFLKEQSDRRPWAELAEETGISIPTLYRWVNKGTSPRRETLHKLIAWCQREFSSGNAVLVIEAQVNEKGAGGAWVMRETNASTVPTVEVKGPFGPLGCFPRSLVYEFVRQAGAQVTVPQGRLE